MKLINGAVLFPLTFLKMELLLNALWGLSSASILAALVCQLRCNRKFSLAERVTAFACISVLLFPVISATDDLCSFHFAAEDGPAVRQLADSSPALDGNHFASVSYPGTVMAGIHPILQVVGFVTVVQSPRSSSVLSFALEGRAPPLA